MQNMVQAGAAAADAAMATEEATIGYMESLGHAEQGAAAAQPTQASDDEPAGSSLGCAFTSAYGSTCDSNC